MSTYIYNVKRLWGDIVSMEMDMSGLLNQLQNMGKDITEIKRTALKKGAEIVKEEISKNCPTDETTKYLEKKYSPGQHLKDNIVFTDVRDLETENPYILIGALKSDRSNFYYAKFLEFGTTEISPRPFIEPSVITVKNRVLEVLRREVLKNFD